MSNIYAVVLAGGRGERFWPLSRSNNPKQFLQLTSEKSMIKETVDRIMPMIPISNVVVVTSEDMKERMLSQIPGILPENILAEPKGKNTCMAVGYAAAYIHGIDPNAVMIVLSCDHLIRPAEKLLQVFKAAVKVAASGDYLITIGIVPSRAETGFGYIQVAELFNTVEGVDVYRVKTFKEKPSRIVAQEYYYDRQHLWNSGMFIWSVKSILKALGTYAPGINEYLKSLRKYLGTSKEEEHKREIYENVENISVDCAILERADNVLTIKSDFIWDDVGSWLALERFMERDRHNNVAVGKTHLEDSFETTVVNDDNDGIITTFGVSDLIIVKTNGIVMVAHKTRASDIKELVSRLSEIQEFREYL
ncbi:MAG: NTP transferase domain-containing protein [candidate division Zixibacteria bacterium]|nr:NTP transferase domain-containing protein [candidate division Zixibacteria bacterium]